MNLHDAKVIGLDSSMQGSGNFAHGFVCGYFDQHGFTSCSTVHFTGASCTSALFLGQLINRDNPIHTDGWTEGCGFER
jgi:hypothetical protein